MSLDAADDPETKSVMPATFNLNLCDLISSSGVLSKHLSDPETSSIPRKVCFLLNYQLALASHNN